MRRMILRTLLVAGGVFLLTGTVLTGCTVANKLERKQYTSQVSHTPRQLRERQRQLEQEQRDSSIYEIKTDSGSLFVADRRSMVLDEEGQALAQIESKAVRVVVPSRNLAERDGKVLLDFLITMPRELQGNAQNIVITPYMHRNGVDVPLEPLQVRGGLFSKLQERNYWRYAKFRNRILSRSNSTTGEMTPEDSLRLKRAFERFIRFPYMDKARFDSILQGQERITYYYTQEVKVEEDDRRLYISLQGKVNALDGSVYEVPANDTLQFSISSMLHFVQPQTRYLTQVIDKYAVVNNRNSLTFRVNQTQIDDKLGNNAAQLEQIRQMMHTLLYQHEFYVDSITLTAASSPEGGYRVNNRLAEQRAKSLDRYLRKAFDFPELDTLLTVKWNGENWRDFANMVAIDEEIVNRAAIVEIVSKVKDPDAREAQIRSKYPRDYKYIVQNIYPHLRVVEFKYNLRRVGMIKDTIHTTTIDTAYMHGLDLLAKRSYVEASQILLPYEDQNAAVALLSRGFNRAAYDILFKLAPTSQVEYLRAIVCSRLNELERGEAAFDRACQIDPDLEYRANLDPEMAIYLERKRAQDEAAQGVVAEGTVTTDGGITVGQ